MYKELKTLHAAYIVLLISLENIEDGWKLNGDRDRFKYKFRQFQDPTRFINAIAHMMINKVRLD